MASGLRSARKIKLAHSHEIARAERSPRVPEKLSLTKLAHSSVRVILLALPDDQISVTAVAYAELFDGGDT